MLISRRPPAVFFPVSLAEATALGAAFFASVDDLDCAASGTARSAQARQATHKRAKRKLIMSSVYTCTLRRSRDRIAITSPTGPATPSHERLRIRTGAVRISTSV